MSREDPQLKIRLPAEVKDAVERSAVAAGRSMNAEIVDRIQRSFRPQYEDGATTDRVVMMDFLILMATQNIEDQQIVEAINKLRAHIAGPQTGDEPPPEVQEAFDRVFRKRSKPAIGARSPRA